MASPEQGKNFATETGRFVRNAGIVVALVGAIGLIAGMTFPGELFIPGAATAAVGEVGRRAAGSGN